MNFTNVLSETNMALQNSSVIPLGVTTREQHQQNLTVLVIVSILITIPNCLVIFAFGTDKNIRRRPANVLICSQACIDLFSGVVYIPTFLVESYYHKNDVTLFLTCYVLFVSLFNLFALSTDRYLALYRPILHYQMIDIHRTIKLILLIWFIPLGLTLIPLTWWFKPMTFKISADQYYLGVVWLFMLILCVAMTILYLCVTKKARRTIRSKRQSMTQRSSQTQIVALTRKELRVVHLFGLLLFFFVAAYLPILYMNFCDILDKEELIPPTLELIGFYSLFLNSIVNPILCISLKKDYLRVFTRLGYFRSSLLRNLGSLTSQHTAERRFTYDTEDKNNEQVRSTLMNKTRERKSIVELDGNTNTLVLKAKLKQVRNANSSGISKSLAPFVENDQANIEGGH